MDPEACLQRAARAIEDDDLPEAHAALEDYRQWRAGGGFEPEGGDERANELRRSCSKPERTKRRAHSTTLATALASLRAEYEAKLTTLREECATKQEEIDELQTALANSKTKKLDRIGSWLDEAAKASREADDSSQTPAMRLHYLAKAIDAQGRARALIDLAGDVPRPIRERAALVERKLDALNIATQRRLPS